MLKKNIRLMVFAVLLCLTFTESESQINLITVTDKFGDTLQVAQNEVTKAAHMIYGLNVNVSRYGVEVGALHRSKIDVVAKRFFADYEDIIKVKPQNLSLIKSDHSGGKWYISYQQIHNNIPVYQGSVEFTIGRQGKIYYVSADIFPNITISTVPSISQQRVKDIAEQDFRTADMDSVFLDEDMQLLVYPKVRANDITYHLVYKIRLRSLKPFKQWIYYVDAQSGEIVHNMDALLYGEWNINGRVEKQYLPETKDDTPIEYGGIEGVEITILNEENNSIASGQTLSGGCYTISWSSDFGLTRLEGQHHLNFSNEWVKIIDHYDEPNPYDPDPEWMYYETHIHEFYPSSMHVHNWE